MSRCKACNKVLTDLELGLLQKNKEPEDLCLLCLSIVYEEEDSDECGVEDDDQ